MDYQIKFLRRVWKNGLITLVVLVMTLGGLFLNLKAASATENQEPPAFPNCAGQTGPGNKEHYDSGLHQIVGNGLLEGSDDVYSLSDGNYLQCFCAEDDSGIQTNWWRTDQVLDGWYSENGQQWNLGNHHYLAKNISYDCGEPEPSPSPSPVPTPTPSPCTTCGGSTQEQHQEQTQENNQTVNITIEAPTQVLSAATPKTQPDTGVSILGLTSMFSAGPIGLALSRFGRGRVSSKKEEEIGSLANDLVENRLKKLSK